MKPVKEGSSVGMSKVRTPEELVNAVSLAHQYDRHALVESFISVKLTSIVLLNLGGNILVLKSVSLERPGHCLIGMPKKR